MPAQEDRTASPLPPLSSSSGVQDPLSSSNDNLTVIVLDDGSPRRRNTVCKTALTSTHAATPVAIPVSSLPVKESAPTKAACRAGPSKILFLDGVRGLATVMVVLEHAGYAGKVDLGAAGVDMFFVLSSFLLTMITERKFRQLLAQKASSKRWILALLDYFSKRFLRVYPLFVVTALILAMLPDKLQNQYFLVHKWAAFDLFKVITFQTDWRYHVYWTLPLEISYYFLIPVFSLAVIKLRKLWWVAFLPLYGWIVYKGFTGYRTSHAPLMPHLPTFVAGSMAAIIYVKIDTRMKQRAFQLLKWHKLVMKIVQYAVLGLIISVCTKAVYFDWLFANPVPEGPGGFRFISVLVTIMIVQEMLSPTEISRVFEWSLLRFWGKISFSVYLLHSFIIYTPTFKMQQNWTDRFLAEFVLTMVMATVSFYLVEYPSQRLSGRISKALSALGETRAQKQSKAIVKYKQVAEV